MFLVLTGMSILLYHIWRISPHRLTFIEPRDYRVVFVLQQSERPENSGSCFHASYHHSNNSFSFFQRTCFLNCHCRNGIFRVHFLPSSTNSKRHPLSPTQSFNKDVCAKRKKGGFRREKLSQNRPEMALHRSGYAKQVEIGVWHLLGGVK